MRWTEGCLNSGFSAYEATCIHMESSRRWLHGNLRCCMWWMAVTACFCMLCSLPDVLLVLFVFLLFPCQWYERVWFQTEQMTAVKVRPGARKWAAGYQADLVCILCYVEGEPPGSITVMSLNSSYGLWVEHTIPVKLGGFWVVFFVGGGGGGGRPK